MELIHFFIDVILHLDKHLNDIIAQYGTLTYGILFLIIFVETGLVVMPFLPGDSLLFAVGALAASDGSQLNIVILFVLLYIAAVAGDTVNYTIGRFIGERVYASNNRWLKREYLEKTRSFYDVYGGKTLVMARFMPIIRTFAPFVAGVGSMKFAKFISFSVLGGFLWIGLLLMAGYFFGNIEIVKKNFSLVVFGIIFLSLLPSIYAVLSSRFGKASN